MLPRHRPPGPATRSRAGGRAGPGRPRAEPLHGLSEGSRVQIPRALAASARLATSRAGRASHLAGVTTQLVLCAGEGRWRLRVSAGARTRALGLRFGRPPGHPPRRATQRLRTVFFLSAGRGDTPACAGGGVRPGGRGCAAKAHANSPAAQKHKHDLLACLSHPGRCSESRQRSEDDAAGAGALARRAGSAGAAKRAAPAAAPDCQAAPLAPALTPAASIARARSSSSHWRATPRRVGAPGAGGTATAGAAEAQAAPVAAAAPPARGAAPSLAAWFHAAVAPAPTPGPHIAAETGSSPQTEPDKVPRNAAPRAPRLAPPGGRPAPGCCGLGGSAGRVSNCTGAARAAAADSA